MRQRTQLKIVTSAEQAEAVARVARERGISKQALIRDAIAAVTGAPNEIRPYPWNGVNGFAAYNDGRKREPQEPAVDDYPRP